MQKLKHLDEVGHSGKVVWEEITPDKNNTWLTADLEDDFEGFIPLGSKEAKVAKGDVKNCIFKLFSNGAKTN